MDDQARIEALEEAVRRLADAIDKLLGDEFNAGLAGELAMQARHLVDPDLRQ